MLIELRQPAREGSLFAGDAFASQVGKQVPVTVDGVAGGEGTVRSVRVVEDGTAALLTVEVDDRCVPFVREARSGSLDASPFVVLAPGHRPILREGQHLDFSLLVKPADGQE